LYPVVMDAKRPSFSKLMFWRKPERQRQPAE